MDSRPNILLLYSDQHNASVLGCYGNREVHTPNLDRLASEGVVFTNAYTQNPICTPSRMCIMSGQYVHNFGYYGLMGRKPHNLPNLFQHVRRHGYLTGMAGKIHTPAGWLSDHCDFVGDGYGYEMPLKSWNIELQDNIQGSAFNEYDMYLESKGLGGLRDDRTLQEVRNREDLLGEQGVDARASHLSEDDTIEAWTAMKINSFISRAHEAGKPFCLWMTVPRPHETYVPAKKFWDMYDENTVTLPPNAEDTLEGRHPCILSLREHYQKGEGWRLFPPKDWESVRRRVLKGYYACVTQVDDAIGRVLSKLDELGIRENTVIVYTSDHGEFAGEHGMIEKAPGIGFRCVTRVPSIWSWPGHLPEGVVRDNLIESVDFLPTVCTLAEISAPDWVDGTDMTETLLRGADLKEIAVTENPLTRTIHTKKYKLTQYMPEMNGGYDFGELFDIENDPWELENLYFRDEYRKVADELRHKLYCWLVRTTRTVTSHPLAPDKDWKAMKSWDLAGELYKQDGKLGKDFHDELIRHGWVHYL